MHFPDYYRFSSPVAIVAGQRALEKMASLLGRRNAHRPMIITNRGIVDAGRIDLIAAALAPGIEIGTVEDGVGPVNELKTMQRIAHRYRESESDSILAVGDGAVMDTAIGVNFMVSANVDDPMPIVEDGLPEAPLKPLISIPTGFDNGLERAWMADVTDDGHTKRVISGAALGLPDATVLDPRLTLGLPAVHTAAAAMHAMAAAVEAYTCLAKNPISDALALQAIELVGKNLLNVIEDPDDANGRLALAMGAALAGVAAFNASGGIAHALGYAVSAVCGVSHGSCMAIMLPYGLEVNMHRIDHLAAKLLLPLAGARVYAQTPRYLRAQQSVAAIRGLNRHLHRQTDGRHACCLKEIVGPDGACRVTEDRLVAIAQSAKGQRCLLSNPEALDHDDLMMIISHAWAGTEIDRERVKKGGRIIR